MTEFSHESCIRLGAEFSRDGWIVLCAGGLAKKTGSRIFWHIAWSCSKFCLLYTPCMCVGMTSDRFSGFYIFWPGSLCPWPARTLSIYTNGCLRRLVLTSGQGFVRKALVSSIMVEPDLHAQKRSIGSDTCDTSMTLLCNTSVICIA